MSNHAGGPLYADTVETAQHLLRQNEPVGDVHRVPVGSLVEAVRSGSRAARRCGRPDLVRQTPHALEKSGAKNELGRDYSATIRRYQVASLRAAALRLQRTERREAPRANGYVRARSLDADLGV